MIIKAPRGKPFSYFIQALWTADFEPQQYPNFHPNDFWTSRTGETWVPLLQPARVLPGGYRVKLDFTAEEMNWPLVFVKGISLKGDWIDFDLLIVTTASEAQARKKENEKDILR